MKNVVTLILLITLTSLWHTLAAQSKSTTHSDTVIKKGQKVVVTNVSFVNTEDDYTEEEMRKFDVYVKKHRRPVPGAQGDVLMSITTEINGTITHIRVIKSLSKAADAEAVRLLKAYPYWRPNTVNGKPEGGTITMPISFGKKK